MDRIDHLEEMLTRLKLTRVRDRLEALLEAASKQEMTFREMLAFVCQEEIIAKDHRRIEMGIKIAKFPCVRLLEQFDFEAQPSIDPKQVKELSLCRWIANGDALLLLGPPGVGKTHLAIGFGREAVMRGYTTLFTTAASLLTRLSLAHKRGRFEEEMTHFSKPKLLIIDELGYLTLEADAAHLFFQLICRRYERGSILITGNRSVSEWDLVFGDSVLATAILDRLLHHSQVIAIRGESYRLREKKRSGLWRSQRMEEQDVGANSKRNSSEDAASEPFTRLAETAPTGSTKLVLK